MLRLRPYKPSDAAKIVAWVSDWDGFSAWCADLLDWPLTEASLEKLRLEFEREADRWLMTALDKSGTPTGFLMMTRADYQANSIHLGLIIVDPARRGQGLGQEMVSLALRYAREILGMERATLRVFAHNRAALACYRRCGFRETGLEGASFPHAGQMWGCYSMEGRLCRTAYEETPLRLSGGAALLCGRYLRRGWNKAGSRSSASGYMRKAVSIPRDCPAWSFRRRVAASSKRTKWLSPARV